MGMRIVIDNNTYSLHVHEIEISKMDLKRLAEGKESVTRQCSNCSTYAMVKIEQ